MSLVLSDGYRLKDQDDDMAYQRVVQDLKTLMLMVQNGGANTAAGGSTAASSGPKDPRSTTPLSGIVNANELQGTPISPVSPLTGQSLVFTGGLWTPGTSSVVMAANGNAALGTSTTTTLTYGQTIVDSASGLNAGTGTYTVAQAGNYLLSWQLQAQINTGGQWDLAVQALINGGWYADGGVGWIRKNTAIGGSGNEFESLSSAQVVQLNVGDAVTLRAVNSSGSIPIALSSYVLSLAKVG